MDIQAVLRWVQRNAAAFGGDPNNVTVGGQSAGASDTGANQIAPSSAGLFHRAIYQSGPTTNFPTAAMGFSANRLAIAAGCPARLLGRHVPAFTSTRIPQPQGDAQCQRTYLTARSWTELDPTTPDRRDLLQPPRR
jgi:para-nitrobenzyl esterase